MYKDVSSFEVVPAFDNNPVQVARYFASGQRLTSVEFADTLGLQHKNLLRDVRNVIDKLTDENREFLCIEESSYNDSIGRELPLFISAKKPSNSSSLASTSIIGRLFFGSCTLTVTW